MMTAVNLVLRMSLQTTLDSLRRAHQPIASRTLQPWLCDSVTYREFIVDKYKRFRNPEEHTG